MKIANMEFPAHADLASLIFNSLLRPSGNRGKVEVRLSKEPLKGSANELKIYCVEFRSLATVRING